MVDGAAHDKLKKEMDKPAEEFIILRNPTTLKVTHDRVVHTISAFEMKDVMRGYFEKEFYMDVITDEEGHKVHILSPIDLSRFTWLPRYYYREFVMSMCEALGILFRPLMMESVVPVRLTPKAKVMFREKTIIEKTEARVEEIKTREEAMKREIEDINNFFRGLKKLKEEEKK
jgi:hypothetical protein